MDKYESELGDVLKKLASQRESRIEEGHIMPDHIHMFISIPPKYSISQVMGYIKGKSAIYIARTFAGKQRNFTRREVLRPEGTLYQQLEKMRL